MNPDHGNGEMWMDGGGARGLALLGVALVLAGCGGGAVGTLEPVAPFTSEADLLPVYREHMVPLVVIGETAYLPSETCVGPAQRYLGGAYEDRGLGAVAEVRTMAGAAEDRNLAAAGEDRRLAAQDENREIGGDTEDRDLAGREEDRRAGGGGEDRDLAAQDENRNLAAQDENRGLGADQDDRLLGGDVGRLECRRLGENAFQVLQAQRLEPRIFMGGELVAAPDGSVRY